MTVEHADNSSETADVVARGLHVMTKPIGPICNLDCAYCYYLDKEELYPHGERWRMREETLEAYVRQYIEAQPAEAQEIEFAWQGGEPTLLGIDFFQHVVDLQKKHEPPGRRCRNSIQTNGVLLNDEWGRFLKQNDVLVGLSIDGPADLHDKYRYDKQGRPTFERVMRGMRILQQYGVEYNTLVVVNRHNGSHGRRIYRFLKSSGVEFIQFIPIVEKLGPRATPQSVLPIVTRGEGPEDLVSERSVGPEQFGKFLVDVFEEWVRHDVGQVFVQIFDQALAAWMGLEPSLCVFRRECGRALAMEHNGDLYSCDHFVEPAYRLGNIHELPIVELANSPQQEAFGHDKLASLPRYCRECEVRFACNGECPKNRFIRTPDGEHGLNYLCAGYKRFFNHIDPYMQFMAREVKAGRPAANIVRRFQAERERVKQEVHAGRQHVRRNDPCPCGSGKKYKACCMR